MSAFFAVLCGGDRETVPHHRLQLCAGNGDAHFKNFFLVPTLLGDHVLSPDYDHREHELHCRRKAPCALDLFARRFETESFKKTGSICRVDFRELARRFRIKPERAETPSRSGDRADAKAEFLLEASLLSLEAREGYARIVADRARALQIVGIEQGRGWNPTLFGGADGHGRAGEAFSAKPLLSDCESASPRSTSNQARADVGYPSSGTRTPSSSGEERSSRVCWTA